MGIIKLVGKVVTDWGNMLKDGAELISGADEATSDTSDTSTPIHYTSSWLLFGEKGSGKHELFATIAESSGYKGGFPHAKDFANVWQKNFSMEDDEGDSFDTGIYLFGSDTQVPRRMLRDIQKFLKPETLGVDIVYPCFLINLKQFMQEGDSALKVLFAYYLFFWRALLMISKEGKYAGFFNPESIENTEYDDFRDAFSASVFNWRIIATHVDEIPEKKLKIVARQFEESNRRVMEDARNSTFGKLFDQMFDHVKFKLVLADLYHEDDRSSALEEILSLEEEEE